ncbi:MAG: methylmalonyl Co-A mutase-associated GTPase MeaB [Chitinophagales bacterium]
MVEGVKPSGVNIRNVARFRRKAQVLQSVDYYVEGILSGNRVILSQAITLIESQKTSHQTLAHQIVDECVRQQQNQTLRIGITGTPGVGKSTFIDSFGKHLLAEGHQVAVLAVDPSSPVSKGSILGDKTRMADLSVHPNAFVRPSPAGRFLGGVAQKTRESILLCEAAGFDIIIIETVGVGQSETTVHAMTDFFLLLLLPGAGDELQGIKRGVVEMADLVAFNKADGDNTQKARFSKRYYQNALHLFSPKQSQWTPKVMTCSALQKEGITDIWHIIQSYQTLIQNNGFFEQNRRQQAQSWLNEALTYRLQNWFHNHPDIKNALVEKQNLVTQGKKSPFQAAAELLSILANK